MGLSTGTRPATNADRATERPAFAADAYEIAIGDELAFDELDAAMADGAADLGAVELPDLWGGAVINWQLQIGLILLEAREPSCAATRGLHNGTCLTVSSFFLSC